MHRLCSQVILRNARGEYLMQQRTRGPNAGNWALAGGKLESGLQESPMECAVREVAEETGVAIASQALRLVCLLHEKNFGEYGTSWTIFFYEYTAVFDTLPPPMEEGHFAFFSAQELMRIPMLAIDRRLILCDCPTLSGASFVSAEVDCDGSLEGELHFLEIRHEAAGTSLQLKTVNGG